MLYLFTGPGKGKTSAALGTIFRALGYGWKVCLVLFMKGEWETGEKLMAHKLNLDLVVDPGGFYKIHGDRMTDADHKKSSQATWEIAKEKILSGTYDLVVLDEINIALASDLLPLDDVLSVIQKRPSSVHLICTGRNAPAELIEVADLVTDMQNIKHPFDKGVLAVKGLDY